MKKDFDNFGIITNTDGNGIIPEAFLINEVAQQNTDTTFNFMSDDSITEAERTELFGKAILEDGDF